MDKNIVINKHGSFYVRNGWPTKILDAISNNESIFSPNKELEAVDEIGVGRVMIKSMRYWASALGIAKESKTSQGVLLKITPLGKLIKKYDPYFQNIGTLWLLHRNLTKLDSEATAWSWAFNLFNKKSFSKGDFCNDFISYLQHGGVDYTKKAIEKEFDCFKNTYVSDKEFDIKKILEEDNAPFFSRLKLISYVGNGIFSLYKKYILDFHKEYINEDDPLVFGYKDIVNRLLLILDIFGVQMFYPYVLKRIKEANEDLKDGSLCHDFAVLESFIVRRRLSGKGVTDYAIKCDQIIHPIKGENDIVGVLAKEMSDVNSDISDDTISNYFNKVNNETATVF